mgnify:CR=1 FL=1
MKIDISTKTEAIKTAVVNKFGEIKSSISEAVNNIKENISKKWDEIKSTISVLLNFVDVSTFVTCLFYLCFIDWCLSTVGTFCPSSWVFKGVSFPYRLYKKFAVGVFCTV